VRTGRWEDTSLRRLDSPPEHRPPERSAIEDKHDVDRADADLALVEAMSESDDRLRALAYHLLGNRDAMDDVLQDVYLKAHRRLATFRHDSSLATWLYRITYTTCLDRLRRQKWTRPAPTEELEERLPPAAPDHDAVLLRDQLHCALATLSPERCAAVLLVLREGHSYAEAGEILGVPAGTVASRVSLGRRQLMRELSLPDAGGDT
jgi:RNA polymerase sigma-70 factor (ECF subfamily)